MNDEPATIDSSVDFNDFWLLWPRRIAKKAAARAWARLSEDQRVQALIGLVDWRRIWEFESLKREDFYEYIPHASTWLNGERWEDEIPQRYRQVVTHHANGSNGSSVAKPAEDNSPTVQMPQYVKDLIAKMKNTSLRHAN